MLSDQEKRELLDMAGSSKLREEFQRQRLSSRPTKRRPMDLDRFIRFLTDFGRFSSAAPRRQPLLSHNKFLI